LAKLSGVNRETIRYYEGIGLLPDTFVVQAVTGSTIDRA